VKFWALLIESLDEEFTMRSWRDVLLPLLVIGCIGFLSCSEVCKIAETEEQNKDLIRRLHAEVSKGNQSIFDEVLSPDYVRHCQAMPPEFQELHGTDIFKAFIADFLSAVPDCHDSILFIIAEDDMVAYVTEMTGTQTGPMGELPASGKEFTLTNLIVHRIKDGKIAETWVSWDNVSMLSQLGHFPPPTPGQP
jgi:steroid delta-isomerase-like uncharacterized protein